MNKRNHGFQDGKNSGSFANPIHSNWPKAHGKIVHFDREYLAGYVAGYFEATGIDLSFSTAVAA